MFNLDVDRVSKKEETQEHHEEETGRRWRWNLRENERQERETRRETFRISCFPLVFQSFLREQAKKFLTFFLPCFFFADMVTFLPFAETFDKAVSSGTSTLQAN